MNRGVTSARRRRLPCLLGTLAVFLVASSAACDRQPTQSSTEGEQGPETRAVAVTLEPAAPERVTPPEPIALQRCQEEWQRLESLEALPGAPELEAHRVEILARAPSTPVVFLRAPGLGERLSPRVEALRKLLRDERWSGRALNQVLQRTRMDLPLRRQVFLPEGYLYADQPLAALRLAEVLRFDHLFDAPEIVVERGGETFSLKRRKGYYVHPELPTEPARLLLFDRLRLPEEPPSPPLHFSLTRLADELGFTSARLMRLTAQGALAELDYEGHPVRAVLDLGGVEAALRCEIVPPERAEAVAFARSWSLRRRRAFAPLRAALDAMVDEALPFDEPKTEIGQQDGQLRPAWIAAYREGKTSYEFNGDEYPVFDWRGRPRVPQVCVDFITDAFERASGGWWAPRGEPRRRLPGTVNFRKLGIENSRSVESLAAFAWKTPEWFDVVWLSPSERIPFRKRSEFFAHLASHASRYQMGDVIVIYGLRSDDRNHYHSFFVYESDPVSGAPTLVAANAGRPRIRTWEAEMRNAPKRTIVARLRPRLPFLEKLVASEQPLQPPRRAHWIEPEEEAPEQERDDISSAAADPG